MSSNLSEYVENYYITAMKLESSMEVVKSFIESVKSLDSNRIIESYQSLVNYIRENAEDKNCVNLYFNRMRCHIQESFANYSMLQYVYFL
jgi:hypothetical protein